MRCTCLLTLACLALPLAARADDPFVDSRLTVTLGDDDLLHDAGDKLPDSPLLGFGDRPGYELFYDNLNTRFSGRESLTHLVFYRKLPSYFDRVTTEAAMVIRALFFHNGRDPVALEDTGSYIRVTYNPFDDPDDGLALTAFPFNADRMRLGYLYDLSVGGDGFYPRRRWFSAPGLRLRLDRGRFYAWGGFKAVPAETALSESTNEQGTILETAESETVYSALGGVGLDLLEDRVRLEAGGAYIEQGKNSIVDVAGTSVWAAGGAARATLHVNMEPEESIDYALYRNDPNRPFLAFAPVSYSAGETAYLLSAEAVALGQHLADPDSYGGTKLQPAVAWAVRGQLRRGYLRLELSWVQRDLAFKLVEQPSFVPFTAISDDANTGPELFVAAAGDYYFPELHLTVGLSAGALWPAHMRTQLTATPPGSNTSVAIGEHTLILRGGREVILPDGEDPGPIVQARASLRLDLSEMLYTRLWLQYGYDSNEKAVQLDQYSNKSTIKTDPHAVGLGLSAALRL